MRPTSITAYLAEAHRQDLVREVEHATLAAETAPATAGLGTAVRFFASDLLLAASHRLRPRLAHHSLLQTPSATHRVATCAVVPRCRYDGARSSRGICLEA